MCAPLVTLDCIKGKGGKNYCRILHNDKIVRYYEKDAKNKLHLFRLTYAGGFRKSDTVNFNLRNVPDVQLTIFELQLLPRRQ